MVYQTLSFHKFPDEGCFSLPRSSAQQSSRFSNLKTGWTVERLTLVEKNILRLGIYEMTEFDTPQIVAVNEAVELAKAFSDETSSRFVNGVLSQFVTEE